MIFNKKLLLIFLLALLMRVLSLSSVPFGFHNDEVDVGYVGKFILLNGRDPAGNFLPLVFNKFGDFRPAGLFYLAGISELVLGTNEFAARLPTALFGALSIWPIFYLSKEVFTLRKPKSGIRFQESFPYWSAFILAIMPWHIELSRAGHEGIVGYYFILWGLYCLFRYWAKAGQKWLVLAFGMLFLSYFFYHGTRFLVPLLLISSFLIIRTKQLLKISFVFMVITLLIALTPLGQGRFSQLIFYKNPGTLLKLQQLPFADAGHNLEARIFHNKPLVYTRELLNNYARYFSPDFLFFSGGFPERYVVPEAGLMYLSTIPFFLWGILELIRGGGSRLLPLIWLFVSAFVAVFTYEDIPSVTRASFMIYPLSIITAYGLSQAVSKLKENLKLVLLVVFGLVLTGEMIFFGHEFLRHQKYYKSIFRDVGAKEEVVYIDSQRGKYDLVIVPFGGNFPFYYLFYDNIFNKNIRLDIAQKSAEFTWGNVLFTRDYCPSHRFDKYINQKVLFINDENCEVKQGNREVYKLLREDGTVVFRAYEQVGK